MHPEPSLQALVEAPLAVGPAGRWTVHEAFAQDDDEARALFLAVFAHEMPPAQWQWKYAHAPMRGMLLRKGTEPVAFFGGMPRAVHSPGGVLQAVQNGDVMVAAAERGVFTRQGALYQVAAAYFDRMVGGGRACALAYGFPNERHFRLGVALGLYRGGGQMLSLTWSPAAQAPSSLWRTEQAISSRNIAAIAPLWRAMQRDWPGCCLPARDPARWQWRYLDHPTQRYELVLLRRRWTGRPLCALVLREHPGHVEWLDYVGPRSAIEHAVASARHFASGRAGKPLVALVSESIAPDFLATAASREPAMPVALAFHSTPLCDAAPLWLMGGDTDFL